jgi:hypothetical protein
MWSLRGAQRNWIRLRELARFAGQAEECRTERLRLGYPRDSWYAENAAAILRVADEAAARLERDFGRSLPASTTCYVTGEESAERIQGATGAAYPGLTIIGFPPRCLSVFGGTVAHELAHLLAWELGAYSPPFKGEGFACYAAERIGACRRPCGIPVHFHLAWLLSVGVRPTLEFLWTRRDYTPELYDLAWSFAAYVAKRFGQERYLAFYADRSPSLRERVGTTLDLSLPCLERDWHDHARARVPAALLHRSRLRRYPGVLCGRAAWLRGWGA